MTKSARRSLPVLLYIQSGLIVAGLLGLSLFPPARGAMALVALDGRAADQLAGSALARGALILGRGPLPNILLIEGVRARIASEMLASGVLVVAAPRSWCGPQGSIA